MNNYIYFEATGPYTILIFLKNNDIIELRNLIANLNMPYNVDNIRQIVMLGFDTSKKAEIAVFKNNKQIRGNLQNPNNEIKNTGRFIISDIKDYLIVQ